MSEQIATIKDKQAPIKLGLTNAALTKLEKVYKEVPDATTKKGYQLIVSAKRVLTKYRTSVEAERKLQVASAVNHQKRVNSVANQIKSRIVAIETPLYAAKTVVDEAEAKKKREAELAEQNRIEDITESINEIRNLTAGLLGATVEQVEERLTIANEVKITDAEYMEYVESASTELSLVKEQLAAAVDQARSYADQQAEMARKQKILDEQAAANEQADIERQRDLDREVAVQREAADERQKKMDEQQDKMDAQQKEFDDRAAEQLRSDEEKTERARLETKYENEKKQKIIDDKKTKAELKKRMPDDMKVRAYLDAILDIPVPDIKSEDMAVVMRQIMLAMVDIAKYVKANTQDPA